MDDRTNYEWYKAHGICPCCQKRKARPGRVTCAECGGKNAAAARRSYAKLTPEEQEAYKARMRECHRAWWAKQPEERRRKYYEQSKTCGRRLKEERKAAGLCVYCGKAPARPERLACEACAAKSAAQAHLGYLRRKEKAYGKL